MHDAKEAIDIIGAGPAGLVAAINLGKAGIGVTLHEAAPGVGHRFHGDFQGIENWTSFLIGLVESFLYGVYAGLVYTPIYNFYNKKWGQN